MGPERIICLTEEYVELLYLLEEENRIAGISSFVKRPPEAIHDKPIVTSFIKANIEKINQLQPDLVLGFSDIQSEIARELIQNHHNVLITNQRSIEEIFQVMLWVGSLIDKKQKTMNLIQKWQEKLEWYRKRSKQKTKNSQKKKVFFQEWDDPIIGGIGWVEELLEILNVDVCFSDWKEKKSAKERIVKPEDINRANPDVIIASWCGKKANFDWIRNTFSSTNAVKENQIYEIPPEIILQPGPALFEEGIDILYKIIYPES